VRERGVPNNEMSPLVTLGILQAFFKLTGLWNRGRANADRLEVSQNIIPIANLPAALRGFRILHLADLHFENNPGMTATLAATLRRLEVDLVVFTGDYRAETEGPHHDAMRDLAEIRASLTAPAFAILGNHDCLDMLPHFESMDLPVLINEGVRVGPPEAPLYLAGVDDPHFYQTHDLPRALAGRRPAEITVLLSHSSLMHREAEASGVHLMLSGHTHGGQFCLPGGISLINNTASPRSMLKGLWRHGKLQGYTSRGIGCTGIPLRFNCPPEIALHILQAMD
jgi:predicted MPP superfamily phosphohydrolase